MIDRRRPVSSMTSKAYLRTTLLASSLLALLASSGAMAQTIDTPVTGPINIVDGASLVITTSGSIDGGGLYGVFIASNASVTVNNAGEIIGSSAGIYNSGGTATSLYLVNSGLIEGGTRGIDIDDGTITHLENLAGGIIHGNADGIYLSTATLNNMTNAGLVEGATGSGISGGVDSHINNLNNLTTGIIKGDDIGIYLGNGNLSNLTNAGTIHGVSLSGLQISGTIDGLKNLATGQILGDGVDGITAVEITNSSNDGLIRGSRRGLSAFFSNITNFNNTGTILATGAAASDSSAVQAADSINNFNNSGLLESVSASGNDRYGINVSTGTIVDLNNSGTIRAGNSGAGDSFAISADVITSLTNSGNIFADLGTSNFAIQETGAGDTNLYLLPGSVIQGQISLGNSAANTDNLYVLNGLSLASLFQSDAAGVPFDNIEAYGALTGQTGGGLNALGAPVPMLVAVADTSVLATQDNALSEMTGGISNLIAEQLDDERTTPDSNWWLKDFGGFSQTDASSPAVAVTNHFIGAATGIDAVTDDDNIRLGLLAGLSFGNLTALVKNGQQVNSKSYFVGAYGSFDLDDFYFNFALNGGYINNDSTRLVANNAVMGGLETASADYGMYFISPEITIGSDTIDKGEIGIKPSARLRYSFLHSDGFTETGSAADLTVGARNTHILDARLQVAVPLVRDEPYIKFELKAGAEGRYVVGTEFDAILVGDTTNGFNPGGARSSIGGFVGLDFTQDFNDTTTIFASGELGVSTETNYRFNAEAGLNVKF